MIKKIGIQNFRIFKEFTEFELKPITILTGTNNSGKSSFTKLLLLLNNGVSKLDFNNGLHNLESFEKLQCFVMKLCLQKYPEQGCLPKQQCLDSD